MRAYSVFLWLFEASVGALVLVPLILLARRFLRKSLGSKLIYALWLLVIVRLLVPLQLPSLFNITAENESRPVSVVETAASGIRNESFIVSNRIAYAALEQPYERITPLHMATFEAMQPNTRGYVWLACYLLGVAAVGGAMLWQNLRFRRRLQKQTLGELDGVSAEQYAALAKQLGVRAPKAVLIDPLDSACLVGGARPFIAMPALNAGDRYIQLHELCHYKGGDAVWGLLRNLCCALFWFHPLVWLAARVSRCDCELACDQRVTSQLTPAEKLGYAELLVKLAACRRTPRMGVLATGMSMTGTRMKHRIGQILLNHRLRAWVLVVAALASLSVLATCFATATVIPKEAATPLEEAAPVPQDEWLARDAAAYFGGFDASAYDNTAVSTRYGRSGLFSWEGDDGIQYAQADLAQSAREWVLTHDYSARADSDGLPTHTATAYSPEAAAAQRERYFCYAAGYDANGALLFIGREPMVNYETERLWERCSGETISDAEYDARRAEVRTAYVAWADAHKQDVAASVRAASELANAMGISGAEVVQQRYQAISFTGDYYALQHITLQASDGRQATFTVEMATERVLAISFTEDYVNGLASEQARLTSDDASEPSALTADPAWIQAQGLAAIARYFGYTSANDATVSVGETAWGYWDQSWWEITVTDGDLRYRAAVSDDGTLRRVTRTPCNVAFPIVADGLGSLPSAETFHLSEKTIFWLCGGAMLDVEQSYPPEVQQALDAVNGFIRRNDLALGEMTEMVIYASDRRQQEREFDAGIEFTFVCGTNADGGERLVDVLYSTIQQDIGHIDFRPEDDVA